MNDEQWAAIVRIAITVLTGPGSYLVSRGVLTADQANQLAPVLIPAVTAVTGIIVGKFAVSAHSAQAAVQAVNSDSVPGVKVVPLSSPTPAATVTSTGKVETLPAGTVQ